MTRAYSRSAAAVLTMNREFVYASACAPPVPVVPNTRERIASRARPRTRERMLKAATMTAARATAPCFTEA